MSMVIELRNDINNNKLTIKEIARKALTMSTLLKLDHITQWLDYEMNGYDENANIPDYRKLSGKITKKNKYMIMRLNELEKPLPTVIHPIDSNQYIAKDSIHTLEKQYNKNNSLKLSNEYTKKFNDFCILISNEQIYTILEQFKDQILRLTLDLESQGILGDDKTFTQEDKDKAKESNITINFNGPISNSPIINGTDPTQHTNYNTDK